MLPCYFAQRNTHGVRRYLAVSRVKTRLCISIRASTLFPQKSAWIHLRSNNDVFLFVNVTWLYHLSHYNTISQKEIKMTLHIGLSIIANIS